MTPASPAIAIRRPCKSYGRTEVLYDIDLETEVLHDIDLEIARGATTCLIGPSGSGKSTLLRCIAFLEEATRGTILVDGQPLGFEERPDGRRVRLSPQRIRQVRSGIGMVFQQFNLWPHMTALGNVTEALGTVKGLSRAEADARGMAQLRRVGLEARARHYPSELSGGQRQRIAIARALALEPEILLFDEPTASLDPELTGEVLAVMRDPGAEGMTMVVVTHEIGFAATVGQRIAFLDHGRVLLNGTPAELFAAPRHPRLTQFLETYLDRGAAMLLKPA